MKAKVERGAGFRGVLNYNMGKGGGNACEIIGGNMSGTDAQSLAAEFALSREARPGVRRPVWHTSLTLPKGENLDGDKWSEIAADFMDGMSLADHQHVVIRHHDTDFDHVHIVASRISLDGGLWHGRFDAKRAIALTQELEEKHDLTKTKGLDAPSPKKAPTRKEVERSIRTEDAPPRMVLQEIVDAALSEPGSVFDFMDRIEAAGASARPNVATTGRMNGFSFELNGVPFKGSDLGKSYTWNGLQGRGLSYEQDRDGAALRERARRAPGGAGEIDGGSPDAVDTAAGPAGDGPEHDIAEIRRIAVGDGADAGNGDREPAVDPFAGDADDLGGGGGGLAVPGAGPEIPPTITRVGDFVGGDDIDSALDRISDLAASDDPDPLAGGPVPALTPAQKAKSLSWQKQSAALGAPEYRLTLKSRDDALPSFSMGKNKGPDGAELFYQPDAVATLIPYLSRQNWLGYDIYITPIDSEHHYLLIDDSTPEKVDDMRSEGFAPALVQESSAGNVQAILKIPRLIQPGEQKAANALVVTLNKKYGDPKLSGVIHPFRMAGFSNKKPGRDNVFTRVIDAAGAICDHATAWLGKIRDRMRAPTLPDQAPAPKRAPKIIPSAESGPVDARFTAIFERERRFAESKNWEIDLSVLDYRTARALLAENCDPSDIAGAMRRRSPDIEGRHPKLSTYINTTLQRAGRPQGRPDAITDYDKESDTGPSGP